MAVKDTLLQVDERVGAPPVALLIGGEDIPEMIGPHAGGRAQSGADRDKVAMTRLHHGPATPRERLFLEAAATGRLADRAVEGDPEVAPGIENRAVSILVVVAGDPPAPGGGQVFVGHTVAIGIAETGHLRALRGVEGPFVPRQPERFVEARGEAGEGRVLERGIGPRRLIENPDLALAYRDGQPAVGEAGQAGWLQFQPLRNWERFEDVILRFPLELGQGPLRQFHTAGRRGTPGHQGKEDKKNQH